MRTSLFTFWIVSGIILNGQMPFYDHVSFNKTLSIPKNITSERSAVIFNIPDKDGEFTQMGEYKKIISQSHQSFETMGIDVIFYLNHTDFLANNSSFKAYVSLFKQRRVKIIIFVTRKNSGYEILMASFDGTNQMIENGSDVFYMEESEFYTLLLRMGKEVRRADNALNNFLIPEVPNYLEGLSIVENTLLKNYPSLLRTSRLAVERFALLDSTKTSDLEILEKISTYNREIIEKNASLEQIMTTYPYEYLIVNPMSNDDLMRNRHQFLLRSVHSSAKSVKQMLDYKVLPNETDFVSIIPIMPDETKVKTIPSNALVYKFYIRQNISKNVHVGEWDADVTWQSALNNMIGNLSQKLNIKK